MRTPIKRRWRISRSCATHTWDYGSEFESLLGQAYTDSVKTAEAPRYLRECLLVNPYIQEVKDIDVSFESARLDVRGTAVTIYGERLQVRLHRDLLHRLRHRLHRLRVGVPEFVQRLRVRVPQLLLGVRVGMPQRLLYLQRGLLGRMQRLRVQLYGQLRRVR